MIEREYQAGSQQLDRIFAEDALSGIKTGATSCLKGVLEAATPQCKDFFWRCLKDYVNEHDELTDIMMKKGWYKPYTEPHQMVTEDINRAQSVVSQSGLGQWQGQGQSQWQGHWHGVGAQTGQSQVGQYQTGHWQHAR